MHFSTARAIRWGHDLSPDPDVTRCWGRILRAGDLCGIGIRPSWPVAVELEQVRRFTPQFDGDRWRCHALRRVFGGVLGTGLARDLGLGRGALKLYRE